MANRASIASVLKAEITRLARKEVRAVIAPVHKQVVALRHDVAALKRENIEQQRELVSLRKALKASSTTAPAGEAHGPGFRFSGKAVRALRKKLAISAPQLATLIGTSTATVYNWETTDAKPRDPALLQRLGKLRTLGRREVARLLSR